MKVLLETDRVVLLHGDCRRILEVIPENSVDCIVTDPPYLLANAGGTGFMGREWDSVEVLDGQTVGQSSEAWHRTWADVALRVLKPGGHMLAFGGSRTFHRMCSAIEDVGFELRDVMMWAYGSGFPKSLDVSKQLDKSDATVERRRRALAFTAWMRSTGLTAAQIDAITGTAMGSHYVTENSQPSVATREHLELLRPHVGRVPDEIEELVGQRQVLSENFALREVLGIASMIDARVARPGLPEGAGAPKRDVAITAPHTDAARKWEGWGTALKPFYEPIALARKPLVGTVAQNVMMHGTGGINIGGCRIGSEPRFNPPAHNGPNDVYNLGMGKGLSDGEGTHAIGRWPSNVVMSHHDECVPRETVEESHSVQVGENLGEASRMPGTYGFGRRATTTTTTREVYNCHVDCPARLLDEQDGAPEGGASRFLYVAKPGKKEKELGLDHLPVRTSVEINEREEGSAGSLNPRAGTGRTGGVRNVHVTCKPVELMKYLVRLVCPPGGTCLDIFAGSGTTGVAALAEGFNFIGVELGGDDGSHLDVLLGRICHALGVPPIRAEQIAPQER